MANTRTRAAVLFTTFTFFAGAAIAHARTSFEIAESSVRAGDLVHFTISGVDGSLTYEVQVDGTAVLENDGDGEVAGTFTMPDLGDDPSTVTVTTTIWRSDRRRTLSSELDYLGPALPVTGPPAADSAPSVPVGAQPDPSPQPAASPKSAKRASPGAAPKKPSSRRRQRGRRRKIEPRRHVGGSQEHHSSARGRHRHDHRRATRGRRSEHRRHHAARGSGSFEPSQSSPEGAAKQGSVEPNRRSRAVLAAARPADRGIRAATVVPALLALAALGLAGMAVLRRRRLASRSKRN